MNKLSHVQKLNIAMLKQSMSLGESDLSPEELAQVAGMATAGGVGAHVAAPKLISAGRGLANRERLKAVNALAQRRISPQKILDLSIPSKFTEVLGPNRTITDRYMSKNPKGLMGGTHTSEILKKLKNSKGINNFLRNNGKGLRRGGAILGALGLGGGAYKSITDQKKQDELMRAYQAYMQEQAAHSGILNKTKDMLSSGIASARNFSGI